MTTSDKDVIINFRHGLRRDNRILDSKIWQWSRGKNFTKREIQIFARKVFEEAGHASFQASDGWYRRWLNRWKKVEMKDKSNENIATQVVSNEETAEVLKCQNLKQIKLGQESGGLDKLSNDTHLELQNSPMKTGRALKENSEFPGSDNTLSAGSVQDCRPVKKSSENRQEDKQTTCNYLSKKKGERYLPEFKAKVVAYALNSSIKEAAVCFKVNKGSVSDWIRDKIKCQRSIVIYEKKPDHEHEFIEWLKELREKDHAVSREMLSDKLACLALADWSREEVNKRSCWLMAYAKRLEEENSVLKSHIMYPDKFKLEVALYAVKCSKKRASVVFHIDRKRIREWVKHITDSGIRKSTDQKRSVFNYVTDREVDTEIWTWFRKQPAKPTSKQVRIKATALYRKSGFTKISCSAGWYYRWQTRHGLPSATADRTAIDLQLICWVLNEFDKNKTVSHAKLLNQAAALRGSNFKASTSWAVRFSKRYAPLLQCTPGSSLTLPITLEKKIQIFQNRIKKLYNEKNLMPYNLIAVDEIPLNFTSSRIVKRELLLRKSGFENCHTSLIVSCSADGQLFPTVLILKGQLDLASSGYSNVLIFEQPNGTNDESIMQEWINRVFFQSVRSGYNILLCDVYKPHVHLKTLYEGCPDVKIMLIPGGCSSKLQPILFGIAEKFKSAIESHWTNWQYKASWTCDGGSVKFPSNSDILKWVAFTHQRIAEEEKEMVEEYFYKTGLITG